MHMERASLPQAVCASRLLGAGKSILPRTLWETSFLAASAACPGCGPLHCPQAERRQRRDNTPACRDTGRQKEVGRRFLKQEGQNKETNDCMLEYACIARRLSALCNCACDPHQSPSTRGACAERSVWRSSSAAAAALLGSSRSFCRRVHQAFNTPQQVKSVVNRTPQRALSCCCCVV
jgi:hypothetical protein